MAKAKIHTLLYYQFVEIKDPEKYAEKHKKMCEKLGLLGKVLVSEEGINGSVAGTKEKTDAYKREMRKDKRFRDMQFKEDVGIMMPFTKLAVRRKKEIIRMDQKLDMSKRGKYVTPKEFLDMYKRGEEMIVLDTRNSYESEVGKFKGAVTPNIETFREFAKVADEMKDKKNKKIVMYCTGGIRCEKASAYMIKKGFKDVSQLHGGIVTFCKEFPNTVGEGKCFVFDKRLLVDEKGQNSENGCIYCSKKCDLYRNCKNVNCDAIFTVCQDCEHEMNACCSEECLQEFREGCMVKAKRLQGKRIKLSA